MRLLVLISDKTTSHTALRERGIEGREQEEEQRMKINKIQTPASLTWQALLHY